jgi:murein DD-endopeptidase
MAYLRPVDAPVSSSWADHKYRSPPSSEPGTDYGSAYGTPILAAEAGTVADYSRSNGGGTGRYLTIDLDDGRRVRYLHLSETWLERGARVGRGWHIAQSGASGHGSDWGYGAHVHTTLFPRHAYDFGDTLDFELYVGDDPDPDPPPQPPREDEDDMPKNAGYYYTRKSDGVSVFGVVNLGSGYLSEWSGTSGDYNDAVRTAFDFPAYAPITESHRNNFVDNVGSIRPTRELAVDLTDLPPTRTRTPRHPLSTQAWIGVELLGLIALVEVVRGIVDAVLLR